MRFTLLAVVSLLAACGSGDSDQTVNRDTLTQRQRDSLLAKSRIPGASGVGRAMTVADSTSARILRADSVANDTTER